MTIRWADFRSHTFQNREDLYHLFPALVRWWFCEEAIAQLASQLGDELLKRPSIPSQTGDALIALVNPDQKTYQTLLPAFFLPVTWVVDTVDDANLPLSLLQVASAARSAIQRDQTGRSFGLHLNLERAVDLAPLDKDPDIKLAFPSAWAPLATALILAEKTLQSNAIAARPTNPKVLITGAWENGIQEVDGIEEKTKLACTWDAASGPIFDYVIVPSGPRAKAAYDVAARSDDPAGKPTLQVRELPIGKPDPFQSLAIPLALSNIKPAVNDSISAKVSYYEQLDQESARQYYEAELFPEIIDKCRQALEDIHPRPTHLISVVSPNSDIVKLALTVLEVPNCLLLYTQRDDRSELRRQTTDMTEKVEELQEWCKHNTSAKIQTAPFSYDASSANVLAELVAELRVPVKKFTDQVPAEQVVIDMQSALKICNYAFIHGLAEQQNLMFWIDHKWNPKLRHLLPLSERFLFWRHGQDWSQPTSTIK